MKKAARRIVEKLRLHGHEAFLAGGWVRDFLLRRQPSDIDIATSALPEEVRHLFPKTTAIGAKFGVVQVRMYGHAYEVTTFRSDGAYLDGRHPSSVSFGGPKQDAMRRDFTINGLFFDPLSERVIDYVHGRADISRRLIQTIGKPEDRFAEDKLRMMRAIRFACSLAFEIAPATWDALEHLSGDILQVSWERIREELLKILIGPSPERGLDLLRKSGLLRNILPEVEAMVGVQQPLEFHPEGDVFTHTCRALALLHKPPAILALGTLLHDVGKPPTFAVKERIRFDGHVEIGAGMAEDICRRLRLSNEEVAGVVDLVLHHLHFMNVKEMRESTLKRFLRKANIEQHLELHRVDCLSSHRDLENYHFCREKLLEYRNEPSSPPPLISGRDLIELGYQPGPIFGEVLERIESLELEGILKTREEALAYVKQTYPMPLEPQKNQTD